MYLLNVILLYHAPQISTLDTGKYLGETFYAIAEIVYKSISVDQHKTILFSFDITVITVYQLKVYIFALS